MKQVISTERIPIKMWLDDIEEGALDQAKNLANLPFAFKHIAIMPDAHCGWGMPIGGVLAALGYVSPNCVGKDVACGVCAIKTDAKEITQDQIKSIIGEARQEIPVGFKKHKKGQGFSLHTLDKYPRTDIVDNEVENAKISLCTLGGGNHFIELQQGTDRHIWIMLHSGSRNLGSKVATHYDNIAKEINKKYFSIVDSKQDLAFLPIDSKEGRYYLMDMEYCVHFAFLNRQLMMKKMTDIFYAEMFGFKLDHDIVDKCMINIAHNYAEMENHFGQNVMVHRKGATRARRDDVGIIPGDQGSPSYIVQGLQNNDSFHSCSHGAGRILGRKAAIRELDLEKEQEKLKGIVHSIRNKSDLDEAMGAYKDIEKVMSDQEDLVTITETLKPLGVIKDQS